MYKTIEEMARRRGIAIAALEQKAGLGNGTIGGWRTASPTLDSLEKVAAALDVKVETIIRRSKE